MPPDPNWGKVVGELLAEHELHIDKRLPDLVAAQVASALAERSIASLVAAEVERRIETLQRVAGALITRDGELVLSYSDGRSERLGSVIGPAGPPGEPGASGPAGSDGAKGDEGPRGRDGTSITGAAFGRGGELLLTLSDGSVLTLDRIEKGDPGPAGPQGPAGEPGPPGAQGEAGPAGQDARAWRHRRNYDPAATYEDGDVVAHDGGSWLALHDGPGELPGAGWAQLTVRGQRGKPGERGERGLTGPAGRGIADIAIGEGGDALMVAFTDGTERSLPLVTR
jgi:hypothetical protein